jgi:hypothetical protein
MISLAASRKAHGLPKVQLGRAQLGHSIDTATLTL